MPTSQTCPVCNGPIEPGDHECKRCGFRLAGSTVEFSPIGDGAEEEQEPVASAASYQYSLYVSKGPQAEENFYLDRPVITLGRDPQCDIFLNDMTVSRKHATIYIEDGEVTVKDSNSLNGTWVDGKVVDEAVLHAGSVLQIGTFKMVLQEHRVS